VLGSTAAANSTTLSIGECVGGAIEQTRNLLNFIDAEYTRPVALFVEALRYEQPYDMGWTERARWIKFKVRHSYGLCTPHWKTSGNSHGERASVVAAACTAHKSIINDARAQLSGEWRADVGQ
jgi:hypothetical protein